VGLERDGAAAVERAVQQEVERVQVWQLVALHVPRDHPLEVPRHLGGSHLLHQERIILRLEGDQPHVRRITLVSRPRVRQLDEEHLAFPAASVRPLHTSTTSTHGSTTLLSTNAGQKATISSGFGLPPANPVTLGGPFKISGAISRVNRSTGSRVGARTPTRSCTSGMSATGTAPRASRPWVASTPTNSVWIASNASPKAASRSRRMRSADRAFS